MVALPPSFIDRSDGSGPRSSAWHDVQMLQSRNPEAFKRIETGLPEKCAVQGRELWSIVSPRSPARAQLKRDIPNQRLTNSFAPITTVNCASSDDLPPRLLSILS